MYKTFIKQIDENGTLTGTSCLTEDFTTQDKAVIAAKENRLSPNSKYRIRKYDESRPTNIISDNKNDTGVIVIDYQ